MASQQVKLNKKNLERARCLAYHAGTSMSAIVNLAVTEYFDVWRKTKDSRNKAIATQARLWARSQND